jgi:catechol 2,3-dioxygenase-like lactoylglutathione lyase family enzyme
MDEGMGFEVAGESARVGRPSLLKRKGLIPEGVSYTRIVLRMILPGLICLQGAVATEEARPKITDLAFARVGVSDMQTASNFYHGELKLPDVECYFGPQSQCFFINPYQQVELVKMAASPKQNRIDAIGMYTSDAAALRKYLMTHGQKPAEVVRDAHGHTSFQIKDPEGHTIEFIQQPSGLGTSVSGTPPLSSRMIHAGFVVKDRAAVDHFYKDILGFRLYWSGGMKDQEADWVAMQVPDGTDWVEYMLNVPENADKRTLGVMNHISLGVESVRAAKEQLEKAGVVLGTEEQPKIGRDGKWQLNLYDPDGTRVELMEFTPVDKPCCSDFTGPHPKP